MLSGHCKQLNPPGREHSLTRTAVGKQTDTATDRGAPQGLGTVAPEV